METICPYYGKSRYSHYSLTSLIKLEKDSTSLQLIQQNKLIIAVSHDSCMSGYFPPHWCHWEPNKWINKSGHLLHACPLPHWGSWGSDLSITPVRRMDSFIPPCSAQREAPSPWLLIQIFITRKPDWELEFLTSALLFSTYGGVGGGGRASRIQKAWELKICQLQSLIVLKGGKTRILLQMRLPIALVKSIFFKSSVPYQSQWELIYHSFKPRCDVIHHAIHGWCSAERAKQVQHVNIPSLKNRHYSIFPEKVWQHTLFAGEVRFILFHALMAQLVQNHKKYDAFA